MSALRPIETFYRGCRFRSRLEARWAVFMDHLGLQWEYEFQGYELPDGTPYLPDFRMTTPQGNSRWLEIKPADCAGDPKFNNFKKALHGTNESATLVSGSPLQWLERDFFFCPRCGQPLEEPRDGVGFYCQQCDFETPSGGGHDTESNGVNGIIWRPWKGWILVECQELRRFRQIVEVAAMKAQGARFEHGERG